MRSKRSMAARDCCMLSDCAGLFSPLSGKPERWVTQLERWPERVVMTPQPSQRWGYTELSLCLGGFIVAPLTSEGLSLVAEHFAARTLEGGNDDEGGVLIASRHGESILPRIIELHFDAWIEREPPPARTSMCCSRHCAVTSATTDARARGRGRVSRGLVALADVPGTAPCSRRRYHRSARGTSVQPGATALVSPCPYAGLSARAPHSHTLGERNTGGARSLPIIFDSALGEGAKSLELTIAEPPLGEALAGNRAPMVHVEARRDTRGRLHLPEGAAERAARTPRFRAAAPAHAPVSRCALASCDGWQNSRHW